MAFNPDGSRVRGFPCVEPPGYVPSCTPVIIDLDGDGDIEICSYAENHPSPAYGYLRVVVYDLPTPYNAVNIDWPMRQHDAQRTGCYGGVEDIQLKEANQRVTEAGSPIRLEQSSPNPMHSTATIQYAICSPTPVRLDIYNVLGQRVRTLIDGHKSPGQYVASWDGKDGAGLDVANGVYIYYLKADCWCEHKKLLVIR